MKVPFPLLEPLTRGVDIDSPENTLKRIGIIRKKGLLRSLYMEWYRLQRAALPEGEGQVLELGSGGGFFHEAVPLISSDVFFMPQVKIVLRAEALPIRSNSLRAITMTNVLHHVPDAIRFFTEAARVLRSGGVVAMIEPWVTPWSKWVYTHLHHEPLDLQTDEWRFPSEGPLSSANSALPYIIFDRDRTRFKELFPEFEVRSILPIMPISYLLSGGVSLRTLFPGFCYATLRRIEKICETKFGMFAFLSIVRR